MTSKPVAAYPKELLNAVYLITYDRRPVVQNTNLKFYGSASQATQRYPSDFDMIENITLHSNTDKAVDDVAKGLQDIIMRATDREEVYVGEFKSGKDDKFNIPIGDISKIATFDRDAVKKFVKQLHDDGFITLFCFDAVNKLCEGKMTVKKWLELEDMKHDLETVRWKSNEVLLGKKKLIGGRYIHLRDAILDKSVCKLDIIAVIGGELLELSNMWELSRATKHKDGFDVENTEYLKGLRLQILKNALGDRINLMKCCKRINTICRATGDEKLSTKLIGMMNGSCGGLYALIAQLKCIIYLLSASYRSIPWKVMCHSLDMAKSTLSTLYDIPMDKDELYKIIDRLSGMRNTSVNRNRMLLAVEKMKDMMTESLNKSVKVFMEGVGLWPLPSKFIK